MVLGSSLIFRCRTCAVLQGGWGLVNKKRSKEKTVSIRRKIFFFIGDTLKLK
jgi:hypothetical protein